MRAPGAGDLDRVLQVRRASTTDDGLGPVASWADHGGRIRARREDVSDGERWRAAAVEARIAVRFVVRWSAFTADLTRDDRVLCEGTEFEITGIKPGPGRRRWLEISAAAVV